jgi:hypothetical protein
MRGWTAGCGIAAELADEDSSRLAAAAAETPMKSRRFI